jgi:flavin-dependent dehydrogenase
VTDPWDVAIVGGGPAGAVAAHVLGSAGRRVLLIDRQAEDTPLRRVGESLPPAGAALLRKIGLGEMVTEGRHRTAYANASSWGTGELTVTDFIRDPHGLGLHLDRALFDADLRKAAASAGATVRMAQVREATQDALGIWGLTLADGTIERARFLIDCTGRAAALARRLGAERVRDDGLIALYAWTAPGTADGESFTLVESAATGWWYTAPLPEASRVIAFHVDAETANEIQRTPGRWEELLAATEFISRAVGSAPLTTAPQAVEACGARLDHFSGAGWLAAGDAALSFDPISSQGIFNALYTGMKAGQTAHSILHGDGGALTAYGHRLESIRGAYRERHAMVYASEQRWPASRFWAYRHGKGEPPVAHYR